MKFKGCEKQISVMEQGGPILQHCNDDYILCESCRVKKKVLEIIEDTHSWSLANELGHKLRTELKLEWVKA